MNIIIKKQEQFFDQNRELLLQQHNYQKWMKIGIRKMKNDGNVLLNCDKNMGPEFSKREILNLNTFKLLDSKNFIQLSHTQQYVSQCLHITVWNFYNDFYIKYNHTWNIKQLDGHYTWFNKMKKIIDSKQYPFIAKLKAYHKIHKNPFEWRDVMTLGNHPTN